MARDSFRAGLGKHNPAMVRSSGHLERAWRLSRDRSKTYGVLNVKWLYISHVIVFETGSALCGGAPDMKALIVGRAIA